MLIHVNTTTIYSYFLLNGICSYLPSLASQVQRKDEEMGDEAGNAFRARAECHHNYGPLAAKRLERDGEPLRRLSW